MYQSDLLVSLAGLEQLLIKNMNEYINFIGKVFFAKFTFLQCLLLKGVFYLVLAFIF